MIPKPSHKARAGEASEIHQDLVMHFDGIGMGLIDWVEIKRPMSCV